MRNARLNVFVFALLAGLLVIGLWPAFQSPGQPEDEGIALVHPEMLLKGRLPYRDFERIYGPGNLLILSAAYSIFGTNVFVERAVGLIYRLLILLAIFGIVQRWGTLIAAGCALVTLVLLGGTDVWANTWWPAVAFALCALWMIAKVSSGWRCFAGGFFGGIALLCRCDFALALMASLLPLLLSMKREARKKFLAGGAVAFIPLLWFGVAVGPAQLVYNLFVLPVFQLGSGGYLPMSAAGADVLRIFYLHIAASTLNIAAGLVALRESTPQRGRLLLGAALLGLGLIHYSLSRFDGGHVFNAALVSFALLPLSIFVLFSTTAKTIPLWLKAAAAILIAFVGIQLLLPQFTRYFYRGVRVELGVDRARQVSKMGELLEPGDKGIFVKQNGRSFPLGTEQAARAADLMLSELQRVSSVGELLFVGPGDLRRTVYGDTWIYYMLPQLRPASYFLEMNPGSANAPGSRLARDVASADWLVLNRAWDLIFEPNRSSEFGPDEPNKVVRAEFDFWAEYGPYLIFRNKRLRNLLQQRPPDG
ncbi:MAG TPA: hypothetical protein VGQ95_04395 [Chthoniobacterales bacterium]|nr:hypothetical protein [Chthoniobacterales bacterium]